MAKNDQSIQATTNRHGQKTAVLCLWSRLTKHFQFLILLGCLAGCYPRPSDDMALADLALKAAQRARADALAADKFRKAENYYLRAKKDYREGYFDSAKKYAHESRKSSEAAEFEALLKQVKVKGLDPGPAGTGPVPRTVLPEEKEGGAPPSLEGGFEGTP